MSLADPILYHDLYKNVSGSFQRPVVDITFKNLNWTYVIVNFILPIILLIILAFYLKAQYVQKRHILMLDETESNEQDEIL